MHLRTGNLRDRVRVHRQQIFTLLYVSHHIAHCAIGKSIPFKIAPVLHVNRNDRIYREEMEQSSIHKVKPELNQK